MSSADDPTRMRDRAAHLRDLANRLETTAAMSLDRHAGSDTWDGPHVVICRATLLVGQAIVHRRADELRWTAHQLARRADEVETRPASI